MNKQAKPIQKSHHIELEINENKGQQKGKYPISKMQRWIQKNEEMKALSNQLQKKIKDQNNSYMISEMNTQRLKKMESQKELVEIQLSKINQKIKQLKGQERSNSPLHIRQRISNNIEAKKMAINLVKLHRQRKKQFQEKKRKNQQKVRCNLTREIQQQRRRREQLQLSLQYQKRKIISTRMNESSKQRQSRYEIEKESNKLVKELLQEDSKLHQKSKELINGQNKYQIKVIKRRPVLDFLQIQKHQSQYLLNKIERTKQQRSASISYPIKSYQKNRWASQLEEEQRKKRQEQEIKNTQKRTMLEKKIKYVQLINSLFLQKRTRTQPSQEKIQKSQSMINQSTKQHQIREFKNNCINIVKTEPIQEQSPQRKRQEQVKKQHLMSLRKQTIKRLIKIQSFKAERKIFEPAKYQSKYDNYLGKVKIKKKTQSQAWAQIINNKQLSQEQKNIQILQKAAALQNRAKIKQTLKEGKDKAVSLYLQSIQAKLALLKIM